MPQFAIEAAIGSRDPDEVYAAVADLEQFPAVVADIQSIEVTKEDEHSSVSDWAVSFRGGVMRWRERDRFNPAARTIAFELIEGDSDVWEGTWSIGDGKICFEVNFDLGMPALSAQMNPLAVRALYDVIVAILRGRIGADVELVTPPPS